MKLMTLNTHSLVEPEYEAKLRHFVRGVLAERPDVIALQEVNQTIGAPLAAEALLAGCVPAQAARPVLADNHAARAAQLLREAGLPCSWTYLPVKRGYDRYDEGLALLSTGRRIVRVEDGLISRRDDAACWKTRRVLAVQLDGLPDWFCCVHMGWWGDAEEPFRAQWEAIRTFVADRLGAGSVWLMGDFNAPAEVRGEGYDCMRASGWHDTYHLARRRDAGHTVCGAIDGWREKSSAGLRIDQIWCSRPVGIASSRVVFNGGVHPVVSDHFGVLIEAQPGCPERPEEEKQSAGLRPAGGGGR